MAVFLIVAYVYSSTKLGKGQNRFYLEVEWGLRGGQEAGGEMAQTMYAHMNKLIKKRTNLH
jgi:hypothetical protein